MAGVRSSYRVAELDTSCVLIDVPSRTLTFPGFAAIVPRPDQDSSRKLRHMSAQTAQHASWSGRWS